MEDCERVEEWRCEQLPTWDSFLRTRGVDYKGDEVLTAQAMQWENVAPALPDEVGSVALESVVELGSKHYVLNFEDYLLDPEDQVVVKPPRVLVPPEHWGVFCEKLLEKGVFAKVHEDDLPWVGNYRLLNGLFGVSKNEFSGPWETMRIIMNMVPLNGIVRSFEGDISTLPSLAGLNPLHLEIDEGLVVSSEDVRCFFYIFKVPLAWQRYMAFNRPLPDELNGPKPGRWYPCSAVLPMGFKNSVSLAQAVHRFILNKSLPPEGPQGEAELRKDRSFSGANPLHRIYLDNFDQLTKVSLDVASAIEGQVSTLVAGLREEYSLLGVPRRPKKSVESRTVAEVQGSIIDGVKGIAYPKVEKVMKYAHLARLLLESRDCTQKQMQIVGGGLVYIAMFRRPLLGGLNSIWKFILQFEGLPPVVRLAIPDEVKQELCRFIGLIPLAYMSFRSEISPCVTASDASTTGGGVTASTQLTPFGVIASKCQVRGDVVESTDIPCVLTVGLFDGIAALRVATDALNWNVSGHISVEKSPSAARVVESRFPNTIFIEDVQSIDLAMTKEWAAKFPHVSIVLIGAGPPCQGVSGLNAAKKGALRDERSCLFSHVPRVRELCQQSFPWAQTRSLMESVASMDPTDESIMSEAFGVSPVYIDAAGVSIARRPRLYWIDWELVPSPDTRCTSTPSGRKAVQLLAELNEDEFLEPGWHLEPGAKLCTFATSRPRSQPGYKPAGIQQCSYETVQRWIADAHRFPPYQYQPSNLVTNKKGEQRLPSIREREVAMGFPRDYTYNCLPKKDQGSQLHLDTRLSLIGNSWNVTVVCWLLSQLGSLLGLNPPLSVGEIVKRTSPGCSQSLAGFLQRPSMHRVKAPKGKASEKQLVQKLLMQVTIKGEDLVVQSAHEDLAKHHRLRASLPAGLWAWKTVASWRWMGSPEHINVLEMRAVLTSLRWRLERRKLLNQKFVHMIDSLVSLHSLSRGRSSSTRLRRTILRINSLLLATRSHAVWAYVHTKDNPADAPSRRPRKRKWSKACRNGS
eukprot:Skav201887  [mRNA]  locus=scaffold550:561929:565006:+ [translate_table: standard]